MTIMNAFTSIIRRRLAGPAWCSLVLALTFLGTGCHKSPGSVSGAGARLFDSAPAEVKTAWDTALAAAKTNDWATAYLTFGQLQTQSGLSEAQLQTISAEMTSVQNQMQEAARKGDPNALKAIKDIGAARRAVGH